MTFVEGDVIQPIRVDGRVDAVWHFAADLRMDPAAAQEISATNLMGTRRILEFCTEQGAILYYLSTAYVSGTRTGFVREDELFCGQTFRNAYEASKAEAERLVQEWLLHHRGMVLRPSIVLGDMRTGTSLTFHGLYKMVWALWLLRERLATKTGKAGKELANLMPRIPIVLPLFSPEARVNIVGAEYVTALLVDLSRRPEAYGRTFHVTNPQPPTFQTLVELTTGLLGVRSMRIVQATRIHLQELVQELDESTQRLAGWLWDQIQVYCPYLLADHPMFDMSNVKLVLGTIPDHQPINEATMDRLYRFAITHRFRDIE